MTTVSSRSIAPFLAAAVAATCAASAQAQGLSAASATPYPYGCPVPSVLANDTNGPLWYTPCPPNVTDAGGAPVFTPFCLQIAVLLEPGEVYVSYWGQNDDFGQPVPPGLYFVNGQPFDVQPTHATGLVALGRPRLGLTRGFELCSPADAGRVYALAASSGTTVGIPLGCGLTFPLDFDALLLDSLTNPAVFPNFIGVLDAAGRTSDPRIVVPFLPSLAGIQFDVAFAVLDPNVPCGVTRVSDPLHLAVLP
jgi:hypothetical protein